MSIPAVDVYMNHATQCARCTAVDAERYVLAKTGRCQLGAILVKDARSGVSAAGRAVVSSEIVEELNTKWKAVGDRLAAGDIDEAISDARKLLTDRRAPYNSVREEVRVCGELFAYVSPFRNLT